MKETKFKRRCIKISKHLNRLQDKVECGQLTEEQRRELSANLAAYVGVINDMQCDLNQEQPIAQVPVDMNGVPL